MDKFERDYLKGMNRRDFFKKLTITPFLGYYLSNSSVVNINDTKPISGFEKIGVRRLIIFIRQDIERVINIFINDPITDETAERLHDCIKNTLKERYLNRKLINSFYSACYMSSYWFAPAAIFLEGKNKGLNDKMMISVTIKPNNSIEFANIDLSYTSNKTILLNSLI